MTISLPADAFQPTEMYFLLRDSIVPRPIAWVSTISDDGVANIAPFSFFNVVSPHPPILGFSCGPRGDNHGDAELKPKDTLLNIRANGEFVVNIVPERLIDPMIMTAAALPYGESEFAHAKLPQVASETIKPPRVAGAPVSYECRLHSIADAGANQWIMGHVRHVHIDETVYLGHKGDYDHRIDLLQQTDTRPVGRLGRANYVRLREIELRLRTEGRND